MTTPAEPLRIGILGAARIAPLAIVSPARATGHRLVAVAARDPRRAGAFAEEHGVERIAETYDRLVNDPEIDVVYNPLPNGLHAHWNIRALRAGKHVLSEKPSASNAAEADAVAREVSAAGTTFMEGFHYLFHPVMHRVIDLVESGALGRIQHVDTMVAIPAPPDDDPRWSLALAGGAVMDLGCYSLHAQRILGALLGGPPAVVAARAGTRAGRPEVDEWLDADLVFPDGATGSARCHMAYGDVEMSLRIVGSDGEIVAPSFVLPHLNDELMVTIGGESRTESLGLRSSYTYQLEAFAAAVRHGASLPLDAEDAVANMQIIDAAYQAAGLSPRPVSTV